MSSLLSTSPDARAWAIGAVLLVAAARVAQWAWRRRKCCTTHS